MTNDTASIISALHKAYCDQTNTQPKARLWERAWWDYLQAGFTLDDLCCVLKWIKRENSRNDFKRSNSLGKLIGGDLTHFDDLCCQARAAERNFKPATPKQQVVQQFRRFSESEVQAAARTVGKVIKGLTP